MAQLRRLKDEHPVDFLTRAAKLAGPKGYVETADGPLCANCAPFGDVAPEIKWLARSALYSSLREDTHPVVDGSVAYTLDCVVLVARMLGYEQTATAVCLLGCLLCGACRDAFGARCRMGKAERNYQGRRGHGPE